MHMELWSSGGKGEESTAQWRAPPGVPPANSNNDINQRNHGKYNTINKLPV
jgi:hypothetical protein